MRYKIMKKPGNLEFPIHAGWLIDVHPPVITVFIDAMREKTGIDWCASKWNKTTRKWERFYPPEVTK